MSSIDGLESRPEVTVSFLQIRPEFWQQTSNRQANCQKSNHFAGVTLKVFMDASHTISDPGPSSASPEQVATNFLFPSS